jgi:hypothetical protein
MAMFSKRIMPGSASRVVAYDTRTLGQVAAIEIDDTLTALAVNSADGRVYLGSAERGVIYVLQDVPMPEPPAPTVTLTGPTNGAAYYLPYNVALSATASDNAAASPGSRPAAARTAASKPVGDCSLIPAGSFRPAKREALAASRANSAATSGGMTTS